MDRIEAIYGYRAEYGDTTLRNRKISTPLPADDLESALTLLSRAIGLQIERVEEDNLLLLH
jgi:ferric-dicitrate binding protein FerR (iron transport regulator)